MTAKENKRSFINISLLILVLTVVMANILYFSFNLSIRVFGMQIFTAISSLATILTFCGVTYFNYKQIENAKIVSFESSLFQMIHLQLEIVNELEYIEEGTIKKGRQVFKCLFEEQSVTDISPSIPDRGMRRVLDVHGLEAYGEVDFIGTFDHYFRNLYRIVKFIDEQEDNLLNYRKKYDYIANNVRSILSKYELIWLYYNCLNEAGNTKFKPLVEKYTLLKNLREADIANSSHSSKYEHLLSGDNEVGNSDDSSEESLPFPQNEYEFYMNIDIFQKNVLDKYKVGAFFKEDEVTKWQQYYLDIRDNGLSRKEAWSKNFEEN